MCRAPTAPNIFTEPSVPTEPNVRPSVLVIAGSDSSGGAGIARDLQTLHDMHVRGVAVVTAVTAQTNTSVRSIHPVPPETIRDQIETALASNRIDAIKIGMLGTRAAVEAVAYALDATTRTSALLAEDDPSVGRTPVARRVSLSEGVRPAERVPLPVVLDPVLAASSGRALADDDTRTALVELLFPRATLVTPNAIEAASLLATHAATDAATLESYAHKLLNKGPKAILLKGGHAQGDDSTDLLICADHETVRLSGPRMTATLRGTGCALASAIAAALARDLPLIDACREGKRYIMGLFERARGA